jgi:FtsP/CotA-like multicopper oxidase with cupredoxin domain
MKDDMMYSATKTLSRRKLLCTTCLVSTGMFLSSLRPLWAAQPATKSAGEFGELNATDPGGIDLYLEHKDLLIGGNSGRAIAINGSIPGPVIRMQEGKEALIRVHNRLNESTSIHWHGILKTNALLPRLC